MDEDHVRKELVKRNTAQIQGRIGGHGHDPSRGVVDVVNQIDATPEEHIYLISTAPDGNDLLWEADLLGDQSQDQGHGRLPPVIHIYCPFCSSPKDARAISITYSNKRFEIEDLKEPVVLKNVMRLDGTVGPFPIHRVLHVAETIQCPYIEDVEGEICGAKFTIRGSRIQRVG